MRFKHISLALLLVLATGCSKLNDAVVATVDGEKITASELREMMRMERGKFDPALLKQESNFAEFRKQALEKLAQEKMLLAEARRLGIKASRQELKELEALRLGALQSKEGDSAIIEHGVDPKAWQMAQERRQIIGKLIAKEVIDKVPLSEEKVRSFYDGNMRDFSRPAQFRARQIIVDSREQADEILAKIKQGEDFGELAGKYSLSPDSKKGGDLGFFDARSYPAIFSEICSQLKAGEISDVVQTDYGYQIFQLLEKRPARQISFEEASDGIRRRLREEVSGESFKKWIAEVEGRYKVAVNDGELKGVTLEAKN